MSNGNPVQIERLTAADRLATATWPRLDGDRELVEVAERFGAVPREDLAQVVRGMLLLLLPPKTYGASRRYEAGYYRFVAMVWVIAKELVDERTEDGLADLLGIERQAFNYHVQQVQRLLAGKHQAPAPMPPVEHGSSPAQSARRGSARRRNAVMRVVRPD